MIPLTPTHLSSLDQLSRDTADVLKPWEEPPTVTVTTKWVMIAGQWFRAPMVLTRTAQGWHERPATEAANAR